MAIASPAVSPLQPLCFPEVKADLSCYYNPNTDIPIPCMLCECIFDKTIIPKDTKAENIGKECRQLYLQHLFNKHKLVIHRTSDITSYRCYSMYWKVRFKEADINVILPVIKTNPETPRDSSEYFHLLSDDCTEDKQLRQFLQRKRLEALLDVQHKERNESASDHACLFCHQVLNGHRSIVFNHMLTAHSFNIGQPDNIVFVDEFFKTLRTKLENLQCLYCERVFRDSSTLKDHMRKKQHRKINPNNSAYDKYYMINYLEIGKTWQEILSEDDKEIVQHTKDNNREDGSNSDDEDEVSVTGISPEISCPLVCLFCTVSVISKGKILEHMKESHGFDLSTVMANLKDDFYGQIKLINYIRRTMYEKRCMYCQVAHNELSNLIDHMTVTCHFRLPHRSIWDQPQYLFPTYENDGLLCVLEDTESQ